MGARLFIIFAAFSSSTAYGTVLTLDAVPQNPTFHALDEHGEAVLVARKLDPMQLLAFSLQTNQSTSDGARRSVQNAHAPEIRTEILAPEPSNWILTTLAIASLGYIMRRRGADALTNFS